jgi:hypothetical protein
MFCYKHAKPEHKKKCANCHEKFAQVSGGLCRGCFGGKSKARESLKCKICKLNTTSRIGGKCAGCLDVKCFDVKKKRVRKRKPKKCLGVRRKRQNTWKCQALVPKIRRMGHENNNRKSRLMIYNYFRLK